MKKVNKKFIKKSLRRIAPVKTVKKGYDYADKGWYYVTVTTFNKQHLFGEIVDGEMVLNEIGQMAKEEWLKSSEIRKEIQLDDFIIMPNHIHGIVMIAQKQEDIKHIESINKLAKQRTEKKKFLPPKQFLEAFISGFKSSTTSLINEMKNNNQKARWQRPYDVHNIHDKKDYERIKQYIADNPKNWDRDIENIQK